MDPDATVWLSETIHIAETGGDAESPRIRIDTSRDGDRFFITCARGDYDGDPFAMVVKRSDMDALRGWLIGLGVNR
jgi:hypothetical protein